MNLLDIIIIALLLIGAVRGFFNGLISELASLLALILGIWMAYHHSHRVFEFLSKFIEEAGSGTLLLSYLIVFALVVILINIAANILTKMAGFLALGLINKILGSIFGGIKALLILLILVSLIKPFLQSELLSDNDFFAHSSLLPVLVSYSELISYYLDVIISPEAASYKSV